MVTFSLFQSRFQLGFDSFVILGREVGYLVLLRFDVGNVICSDGSDPVCEFDWLFVLPPEMTARTKTARIPKVEAKNPLRSRDDVIGVEDDFRGPTPTLLTGAFGPNSL